MTLQGVKRKVVTVSDFRFTGRLLGKGNFARVEEAIHNVLNVKVAIKVINIAEIKEKYVVKNLHREARIMSNLHHPCIAALFQTMQLADNVYYLVTELVSGGDLCTYIIGQRFGKLEERTARLFGRQFASAVAHMHSYGIVHRDLKMENVILNANQTQIKIVDFGLSNVWTNDSPLRTHCGSPEYAAPELFIAGKEYGPEVDLWSLGIIFYGMVVGQLPFVGGRKHQLSSQERRKRLVAQISRGLGTLQRQAIAQMSPEFRAVTTKLLTPEPQKRLTITELVMHPWITDKGKKHILINPFKKPDAQEQNKLTKQIADLFEMEHKNIVMEICKNPYGRFGGMYNIMCFNRMGESFTPDKIMHAMKNMSGDDSATTNNMKRMAVKPKTAPPAKSHQAFYNQCVVLLNKVSKQQIIADGANNNTHRTSKSANDAHPVATTAPKMKNVTSKLRTKTAEPAKISRTRSSKTGPVRLASSQVTAAAEKMTYTKVSAHTSTRPHTTDAVPPSRSSGQGHMVRAPKRPSVSPSAPAGTASVSATRNNRDSMLNRQQICTNPQGMGDGGGGNGPPTASGIHPQHLTNCELRKQQRPSTAVTQKAKGLLANEPIARSIAGYLVKNVPDKMFNFQMMRK